MQFSYIKDGRNLLVSLIQAEVHWGWANKITFSITLSEYALYLCLCEAFQLLIFSGTVQ